MACDNIDETIKPIVSDLCGSMLDTQSFSKVSLSLRFSLRGQRSTESEVLGGAEVKPILTDERLYAWNASY